MPKGAEFGAPLAESLSHREAWEVDNSLLKAKTNGLCFRRSPNLVDRHPEHLASWGIVVYGNTYDNDWLQVGKLFLPFRVGETEVLRRACGDGQPPPLPPPPSSPNAPRDPSPSGSGEPRPIEIGAVRVGWDAAAAEGAHPAQGPPAAAPAAHDSAKAPPPRGSGGEALGRGPRDVVDRERLIAYLARRQRVWDDCSSLPFALVFFAVLFALLTLHLQLSTACELAAAVEAELRPWGGGEEYPAFAWAWVSGLAEEALAAPHTHIIGGVRLHHLPEGDDETPEVALCGYTVLNFIWDALRSGFAPEVTPSLCWSGDFGTAWLHWPLERAVTEATLSVTRSEWEARALSGLEAQVVMHNDAVGFYVLYRSVVRLDPSGLPLAETEVVAFPADLQGGRRGRHALLALDLVLLAMCFLLATISVVQGFQWYRKSSCRTCVKEGISVWKWGDLLILSMGCLLTIYYLYCNFVTQGLHELVGELPPINGQKRYTQAELEQEVAVSGFMWSRYLRNLDMVLEQAQRVTSAQSDLRWYASVMAIASCMRFFKAFRSSLRLNIITTTMWNASCDLAHWFAIFYAMLSAFVVTGYMTYGDRIEAFSSGGRATESTLLFLAGFTFNEIKDDMRDIGGLLGVTWVFFLNTSLLLIVLKITLPLVVNSYIDARTKVGNAPTLPVEAWSFATERRQRALELEVVAQRLRTDSDRPDIPPPLEERQRSNEIKHALGRFSERKVYRLLAWRSLHPDFAISSASLAEALGAQTWAEQAQVDMIVSDAITDCRNHARGEEAISSNHFLRLLSNIDANVLDVYNRVGALTNLPGFTGSDTSASSRNANNLRPPGPRDARVLHKDLKTKPEGPQRSDIVTRPSMSRPTSREIQANRNSMTCLVNDPGRRLSRGCSVEEIDLSTGPTMAWKIADYDGEEPELLEVRPAPPLLQDFRPCPANCSESVHDALMLAIEGQLAALEASQQNRDRKLRGMIAKIDGSLEPLLESTDPYADRLDSLADFVDGISDRMDAFTNL